MEVSGCFHLSSADSHRVRADCWLTPSLDTDDTDTAITAEPQPPPALGPSSPDVLFMVPGLQLGPEPGKLRRPPLLYQVTGNVRQWHFICNVQSTIFNNLMILFSATTFHHVVAHVPLKGCLMTSYLDTALAHQSSQYWGQFETLSDPSQSHNGEHQHKP